MADDRERSRRGFGLTLAGGLQHLKPLFGIESDSVRLSEPPVLQGLPRLTDPEVQREAATAKSTYGTDVDSVVAVYGASSEQPELMVHVVAASLKNPETNLDRTTDGPARHSAHRLLPPWARGYPVAICCVEDCGPTVFRAGLGDPAERLNRGQR
ncbi:hypothetical protein [Nocardia salmonicida]|uniref:hypothetical protein n=1 Tax=Nocardia salmonicida TaxID=53431 RepID=UPI0033E72224